MAMTRLPAAVVQPIWPWTSWALPSMVTFAVPEPALELPAADEAEADAVADEPDDAFLSSLEQPVRPAARTVKRTARRFRSRAW